MHSVLGSGLRFTGRGRTWPLERVRNASVTEVILTPERFHLQSYNDARHASPAPGATDTMTLVRHAESAANVSGKWHGRTDGPLSDRGLEQADRFAGSHPRVDRVFTSPLQRARGTAEAFARQHSLTACHEPDLMEIDFGVGGDDDLGDRGELSGGVDVGLRERRGSSEGRGGGVVR